MQTDDAEMPQEDIHILITETQTKCHVERLIESKCEYLRQ